MTVKEDTETIDSMNGRIALAKFARKTIFWKDYLNLNS